MIAPDQHFLGELTTPALSSRLPCLLCEEYMKGYTIDVRNNLLERKHFEAMGEAVWLYMWFLDKMTSVNENGVGKVLGSSAITHDLIFEDLGIPHRTYLRYVDKLRDAGYINTVRLQHGLLVTITKAKKNFSKTAKKRSDKNGVSKPITYAKTVTSDTPNMSHQHDKNGVSLYIDDNSTVDSNSKINTGITNVIGETPEKFGSTAINEMFDCWKEICGYDITSNRQKNRNACSNLLKKHGADKLTQLIRGVALSQDDQYAPRISDFAGLQSKLNDLLVWGRRKGAKRGQAVDLTL